MVTSPEADLALAANETIIQNTRYALQRSRAARRGQLPTRLLLHRARTEGRAHRRLEEWSEQGTPFSHPNSWE